jgi:hypothetical protein
MYADELGRKYSGVKLDVADMPLTDARGEETIYNTSEGPVVITVRDKYVFVSESFDLATARKLGALLIDGQGTGEIRTAKAARPMSPGHSLTASWVSFMHSCGVMKAALVH